MTGPSSIPDAAAGMGAHRSAAAPAAGISRGGDTPTTLSQFTGDDLDDVAGLRARGSSSRHRCRSRRGRSASSRRSGRPAAPGPCGTCGVDAYCADDWCGRYTPARPHAYLVRPEQSNATPGDSAANRYGTPSWPDAALTAMPAVDAAARGTVRRCGARREPVRCGDDRPVCSPEPLASAAAAAGPLPAPPPPSRCRRRSRSRTAGAARRRRGRSRAPRACTTRPLPARRSRPGAGARAPAPRRSPAPRAVPAPATIRSPSSPSPRRTAARTAASSSSPSVRLSSSDARSCGLLGLLVLEHLGRLAEVLDQCSASRRCRRRPGRARPGTARSRCSSLGERLRRSENSGVRPRRAAGREPVDGDRRELALQLGRAASRCASTSACDDGDLGLELVDAVERRAVLLVELRRSGSRGPRADRRSGRRSPSGRRPRRPYADGPMRPDDQ